MPKKESRISTASPIKCCHKCVAPKRHPACWGHCPEYQQERAEYEKRKDAYYGGQALSNAIVAQRTAAITKFRKGGKRK